ncbi:MAG TPA: response regulator, partial [Myxococcota bacterium]
MKTALVVEDDSAIATLVKDALEIAGFRVVVEKDGEAGLRALTKALPDVLVTDLLLPVVPGLELIGKLRSLPKGDAVAVVVISGIYKSSRHKRTAREQLGVYASVDKPFEVDVLVRTVKEAVGLRAPATVVAATPMATPPEVIVELVRKKADGGDVEKAVRGNLKQRRFPEVLAQVFRFRATGALLLRRGRIKKIVYVKDGLPTFVKSNMLSECLGRVLVREKLITEAECERSVELLPKSRGKLQGQVLIELGALSPQNLTYGLQLQLEQKLYDVFSWPDGDYQFNTKVDFPSEGIGLDVSLANLILEGVRRRYSDTAVVDLLERHIDHYLAPHAEPNHRLSSFDVDSDERTLLALVDGRRTTREVIEAAGIPVRVARQIVYALIASELATTTRRPATLATTTPKPPAPAAKPPPRPTTA